MPCCPPKPSQLDLLRHHWHKREAQAKKISGSWRKWRVVVPVVTVGGGNQLCKYSNNIGQIFDEK